MIVGYAKNPSAKIVDMFPFLQGCEQAKKDFLGGLLGLGRPKSQCQQIPVDIVAGLFIQARDRFFARHRFGLGVIQTDWHPCFDCTMKQARDHWEPLSTQMAAPLNDWPSAAEILTVRFDSTGAPHTEVPAGGGGTTKLIWYKPTWPGTRPAKTG